MKSIVAIGALLCACYGAILSESSVAAAGSARAWNPQAAAAYLDARQDWWMNWPKARRDHGTFCISCHTAVPYGLADPRFGRPGRSGASPNRNAVLDT